VQIYKNFVAASCHQWPYNHSVCNIVRFPCDGWSCYYLRRFTRAVSTASVHGQCSRPVNTGDQILRPCSRPVFTVADFVSREHGPYAWAVSFATLNIVF